MRTLILLAGLFFAVPAALHGQYILQLKNSNTGKVRERYCPGNTIRFQLAGSVEEVWGKIDSIGRDTFFIRDVPFAISSIEVITLNPANCNWRVNGAKLIAAGIAYPGIEAFNSLNNDHKLTISKSTIIVSVVLIATGYIMFRIGKRTFLIGEKYHLKTI